MFQLLQLYGMSSLSPYDIFFDHLTLIKWQKIRKTFGIIKYKIQACSGESSWPLCTRVNTINFDLLFTPMLLGVADQRPSFSV